MVKNPIHIPYQPTSRIYRSFRRYNYPLEVALGEFIDNSIQSAMEHKMKFLKIEIEFHRPTNQIILRDYAGGISTDRLQGGALQPGAQPLSDSGMNEFGQGLKAAATDLANSWKIRTSARGESKIRTIHFDIETVASGTLSTLQNEEEMYDPKLSFTEITLDLVSKNKLPVKNGLAAFKRKLGFMYSNFIDGFNQFSLQLDLFVYNQENQSRSEHKIESVKVVKDIDILSAHPFTKNEKPNYNLAQKKWKTSIHIPLLEGRKITGSACIKAKGSTRNPGFAIFRRGRFITYYKPSHIFGESSSTRISQRICGELNLTGFNAGPRKDTIPDLDDDLEIAEAIKQTIQPLLTQASNFNKKNQGLTLIPSTSTQSSSTDDSPPPSVPTPSSNQKPSSTQKNVSKTSSKKSKQVLSEHNQTSPSPVPSRLDQNSAQSPPLMASLMWNDTTLIVQVEFDSNLPFKVDSSADQTRVLLNRKHPYGVMLWSLFKDFPEQCRDLIHALKSS